METQTILREMKYISCSLPKNAINSALLLKDEITPHLLDVLKKTIVNYKKIPDNQSDYFFSLYILAKFREQAAFPLIIELASLPDDFPEMLLGDAITVSLTSFLVSTFNGDVESLKRVVCDDNIYSDCRIAALFSFVGLWAIGKISRTDLIMHMKSFYMSLQNDSFLVTHFVLAACDICPHELHAECEQAFASNLVDASITNKTDFDNAMQAGEQKCLENLLEDKSFLPIDDVLAALEWLEDDGCSHDHSHDHNNSHHGYEEDSDSTTYIRTQPKIGRNDPCLCGSGKKYKKCCLM